MTRDIDALDEVPRGLSECDGCGLLFDPCDLQKTDEEELLCDYCRTGDSP